MRRWDLTRKSPPAKKWANLHVIESIYMNLFFDALKKFILRFYVFWWKFAKNKNGFHFWKFVKYRKSCVYIFTCIRCTIVIMYKRINLWVRKVFKILTAILYSKNLALTYFINYSNINRYFIFKKPSATYFINHSKNLANNR